MNQYLFEIINWMNHVFNEIINIYYIKFHMINVVQYVVISDIFIIAMNVVTQSF